MEVHPLAATDSERREIALQYRYDFAQSLLRVNAGNRRIMGVLLVEGPGWSRHGLSEYVNIPRTTVRKIVGNLIEYGSVSETESGLGITLEGKSKLIQLHRETIKIAVGIQIGYSLTVIEWCDRNRSQRYGPDPRAATISFPQLSSTN